MIHGLSQIVKQKNLKNYEEWIMETRENQNSELGSGSTDMSFEVARPDFCPIFDAHDLKFQNVFEFAPKI